MYRYAQEKNRKNKSNINSTRNVEDILSTNIVETMSNNFDRRPVAFVILYDDIIEFYLRRTFELHEKCGIKFTTLPITDHLATASSASDSRMLT